MSHFTSLQKMQTKYEIHKPIRYSKIKYDYMPLEKGASTCHLYGDTHNQKATFLYSDKSIFFLIRAEGARKL